MTHAGEVSVGLAKKVYTAYHSGQPVAKAVLDALGAAPRLVPAPLPGDALPGAMAARAKAEELEAATAGAAPNVEAEVPPSPEQPAPESPETAPDATAPPAPAGTPAPAPVAPRASVGRRGRVPAAGQGSLFDQC